jgi:acyl-CoA thioester hydrolase
VSQVYTARVVVRHDELDRFGRAHPAVYLRYLAHAAVEASTAAGFEPDWYARNGTMWLVRRSTLDVARPVGAGPLEIRTWVEDFRRVRSFRRYEVRGPDGALCAGGLTDWVYVDALTGRPRRVPAEMESAFGTAWGTAREREPWDTPAPPPAPAVSRHRVRIHEVDSIGHVNNAAYLDLVAQATLDALADVGWPLERLIEADAIPVVARADLEYLDGARYGDDLELRTWCGGPLPDGLDAHHLAVRTADERLLVRAATRWRCTPAAAGRPAHLPDAVRTALGRLLAA